MDCRSCDPFDPPLLGELRIGAPCGGRLREAGRTVRFPPRAGVFVQGERSGRVGIIQDGTVNVSAVDEHGRHLLVAIRGPGDLIGELAPLGDMPQTATITARTSVSVLLVPTHAFVDVLNEYRCMTSAMMRTLAARLRESDEIRLEMATKDVTARVASRLLQLMRWSDEPGDGVQVSQTELAAWVGASREAVGKAISTLRASGVIRSARGRVFVEDEEALRTRAAA